jgi:hypothetical protein
MSFRFLQVGTTFLTNDGLVLAVGSLTFTDSGTTTPRTTWSDPGMTTPNPNPVPLDGAGRPNVDIWGDGSYRVVLRDALGAVLVTLDDVSGPVGIPDPALQSGKFLTNDGTVVFWEAILQVPDPAGQPDGNVLTTDGASNIAWEALPTTRQVPDPAAIADGSVLTRDDASPGDYAWKPLPSATKIAAGRVLGGVLQVGSVGVTGITPGGTGVFTIDVTAAGFTQVPSGVASITLPGINPDTATVTVVSATSVEIRTSFGNTLVARDFNFIIAGV